MKSFLGNYYRHLAIFSGHTVGVKPLEVAFQRGGYARILLATQPCSETKLNCWLNVKLLEIPLNVNYRVNYGIDVYC